VIYAPQDLFDAFDEIEAGDPERKAKVRLIKQYSPTLPEKVRQAPAVALRTKDFSAVPGGWDVYEWPIEELEKAVAGLDADSDQP